MVMREVGAGLVYMGGIGEGDLDVDSGHIKA